MSVFTEAVEGRGTVDVCFDDRSRIRIRKKDWIKHPLEAGEDIEIDRYEKLIFDSQMAEAYEAALSILDYSAKTESEIRKKLSMKGYLDSILDYVTERLKNARLIDDRMIAERIAEGAAARGIGQYALKRKLRTRGITEDDTEYAMTLVDEEAEAEGAKKEAAKLFRKYASLEKREARNKLSQALARRGYSWDAVTCAVEEVFSSDADFDDY